MSFPRTDAGIFCKRDCRIKSDNDKFLEMETIVLHEGEYVLTSNGSIDFGKITAEMASLILSMNNHKNKNIVYVELRPGEDGDYWSVLSGLIALEDI